MLFHITKRLYEFLKGGKNIDYSEQGRRGADGITHTKTVNTPMSAYAIEDLPPLTEKELAELAKEQLATGRLDSNE